MTIDPQKTTFITRLRQAFSALFRERHVAVIEANRKAPKLEPIAKILSSAGRDRGAPVD